MLVYPQLGTGATSQFPIQKQRRLRTVVNAAADGSSIKLPDPTAEITEWRLPYVELSDEELATLQQFFAAAEGTLNAFTFLDPMANLLAWSDELDQEVWTLAPFLSVTKQGGNVWRIANAGLGAQSITQTLSAPAEYSYCFSAYARSALPGVVTMRLGEQRAARPVGMEFTRIVVTGIGEPTFGLELPAGASVDVYGMQVEPQAGASVYKATTNGGVYEGARLRDDVLAITSTDVNRHSCTVNIIHANHL